jgi:hypothetical protein
MSSHPRTKWFLLSVAALCLVAIIVLILKPSHFLHTASAPAAAAPTVVTCADSRAVGTTPALVPTSIDSTCSVIPSEVAGIKAQNSMDVYAWLAFISANWPADPTICSADTSASILTAPPNPVWLTFNSDASLFVPKGMTPAKWCPQPSGGGTLLSAAAAREGALSAQRMAKIALLPAAVKPIALKYSDVSLYLVHDAKGEALEESSKLLGSNIPDDLKRILQATRQPIVDQNGRFARYAINMSQAEYQYLLDNNLWTSAGQAAAPSISFPAGEPNGPVGSIEYKSAWKIIGKGDDPTHFFTQKAIIYNDQPPCTKGQKCPDPQPSPEKQPVLVGLIGLHIVHKTANNPGWVWATFEQDENDTTSFFNPHCTNCAVNTPPTLKPYQELDAQGNPLNPPTQIKSIPTDPEDANATTLNATFQGYLKGTPWAYYKLVSAQWMGEFSPTPFKPQQMGNNVMETYVTPGPDTYGCLQCHTYATAQPSGKKSDRSFVIAAQQ